MLSKVVKKRRQQLGLTQAEVAERAGIGSQYVARLETQAAEGGLNPTLRTLEALAEALECTLSDLLGEKPPDTSPPAREAAQLASNSRKLTARQRNALLVLSEELAKRSL